MLSESGDIIPPAAFLPMAERFGVIGEIGRSGDREIGEIGEIDRRVTAAGLRLAIDGEGVAINLSGYSIDDQSIIAEIRSAIGADYAQGFHFGAPKRLSPPTAFERQRRAARAVQPTA
jgi:EAL domain-containing protein (putative c-di-GMP-specific phosphodiesterase class I)